MADKHIRAIQQKANIIRAALMRSDVHPSGASASEWCHALVIVCGELLSAAPASIRGQAIEDVQSTLFATANGGHPSSAIAVPVPQGVDK